MLWCACLDVLLGLAAGWLLVRYGEWVLTALASMHSVLDNQLLRSQIQWLMGWPAGFKLNDHLDQFLGRVFLFYIERWSGALHPSSAALPRYSLACVPVITSSLVPLRYWFLGAVSVVGALGGLSYMLAVLLDILSFFTFHVTCFYTASARIYQVQLNTLSSLWKLFRGRRVLSCAPCI